MKTSPTFWLTVLLQVLDASIAIGVIIFMTIPKAGRREYRYLGAFLCVWLTNDLISTIGYFLLHIPMNTFINCFEFLFVFTIVMMYKNLIPIKNVAAIAYTVIGVHLIFGVINFLFIQGPYLQNSYTWIFSNIIAVSMSLYYFYFLIKKTPLQTSLTRVPTFWINLAVLITYTGTVLLFISQDYLVSVLKSNLIVPTYFHASFGISCQLIIWYALLMIRTDYRSRVFTI